MRVEQSRPEGRRAGAGQDLTLVETTVLGNNVTELQVILAIN